MVVEVPKPSKPCSIEVLNDTFLVVDVIKPQWLVDLKNDKQLDFWRTFRIDPLNSKHAMIDINPCWSTEDVVAFLNGYFYARTTIYMLKVKSWSSEND